MAIDPSRLKPSDVTRLLNSTPLGTVIDDRQLYRHRQRAGFRISPDGRTISLFKYLAWLVDERHGPQPEQSTRDYEAMKEAARARNAALSAAGRDIGELPEVVDPERRERCRASFRAFCEAYFPLTFSLAWSPDHLRVIAKIEQAVLHGGLFAMAMPRGSGKALALDTPLPTPSGWTTMGDVAPGDWLFDERGQPCPVLAVSPVMVGRACYEVRFSDGERIVCDADHLWTVEDRYSRRNPLTLATRDMLGRVDLPDSRDRAARRYRMRLSRPLQLPCAELPIEPYALGVWLGNGTCSCAAVTLFEEDTQEIIDHIDGGSETASRRNYALSGRADAVILTRTHANRTSFQGRLRQLSLLDNKHIPRAYLRASWQQRLCLLQGLMDTDGSVNALGHCEITLKQNALADDFGELLSSLGIKFGCSERMVAFDGKLYGPYRRFHFVVYAGDDAIRLERKHRRLRPRPRTRPLSEARHVTAITAVPSVPVKCVQVGSPSQLYLAGRKMVPTHNSSLAECACLWAMLYGHRDFVTLIGSDEGHALGMLESIRTELDANDLLLEDFPAACHPIRALDGIANRCSGQLYKGERTQIGWTANEIVLPTIPGSEASGAVIRVAGITGRIRGMKFKRPDGHTVRPSLVVLDDPQTDESARSLSQCANRERILAGAVLGLAGPGKKISGIMPCTVIRPGDMADRILDREKHPEWNGERTKMVYAFPADEKLWGKYAEVRAESLREHGDLRDATAFYVAHREQMDEGAEVAWAARVNYDEASALQHAMNLKLQDEAAFWAEYQNEPLPENVGEDEQLSADQIAQKLNGHRHGEIPIGCNHLTMFVDVQGKLLFWVVCAWESDFTGYVVEYGTFPDQRRRYFTLRDASPSLLEVKTGAGIEGSIYAGLESLTGELLAREWRRDDGAVMKVGRCLIDANWGTSTDVVYQFCRQSAHAAVLFPSHGRYVGASSTPFAEYRKKQGDRVGLNWRIPNVQGRRAIRHVLYDTNFWKSFVHARLAVAMGDPGCVSLYGRDPVAHQLFAEHLTAEYRVKTEGRGRVVDEWKLRPEAPDNHWLDGIVGCAVAASIEGAVLPGTQSGATPMRERIRLSALKRHSGR